MFINEFSYSYILGKFEKSNVMSVIKIKTFFSKGKGLKTNKTFAQSNFQVWITINYLW